MRHFMNFNIFESTSHYLPSLSDDGTADHLSEINKKTSKIVNTELKKKEDKILTHRYDTTIRSDQMQEVIQKWMYANMVMTSLQQGFRIELKLIQRAHELYQEVLDTDLSNASKDNIKWQKSFKNQINLVVKRMLKLKPLENGLYYNPGFMKDDANSVKIV